MLGPSKARAVTTAAIWVALTVSACGGGSTAEDWVDAVERERWGAACELMVDTKRDCQRSLAALYANRTVTLLPAGAYQNGESVTNNQTRFALEAVAGPRRSVTYFEVAKDGVNAERVGDLVATER